MSAKDTDSQIAVLGLFDPRRTARLAVVGGAVLRYGLAALLLLWGAFKFAAFEAEGIRPLVEHSPLLSWLYPLLGVRGASALIGVVEVSAGVLICTRRWSPVASAVGSLLAVATFVVTLSFLFSTPGVMAPTNPFGGFLLKDIMLMGAAISTAAEAIAAARLPRRAAVPPRST